MPIYEYRCEQCGHHLEQMQKLSDPPLTDCPACAAPTLKKQISAAGFRLKGGGWYETDFKKGGTRRNLHETGAPTASGSGGTETGGTGQATTPTTGASPTTSDKKQAA